jgi:hypothetical protein
MSSPFGREEGAVLVAVERANGGELAPLVQVLWALNAFTPPASRPDAARFAASASCLVDLGIVEYLDGQLGLTVEGRKLLRRSGLPNDPRHVLVVTGLLQEFDDLDIDRDEPVPGPTEEEVRRALSDEEDIEETEGGVGTPFIGAAVPNSSVFPFGSHWVPAVPPEGSDEVHLAPEPPSFTGAPAHPLLERIFGRRRRDLDGRDR